MADEEATRGAAHVLLDMLSAFDAGLDDHAVVLAAQRLNDVGAITATRDDEAGVTTMDARPLISAALNLLSAASRWCSRLGPTSMALAWC
jgi:hypothetical protein